MNIAGLISSSVAQATGLLASSAPSAPAQSHWPSELASWGYRPFIDPLNLHNWWWALIVPLALGVSVAYKAVRLPNLDRYWREVGVMTLQVLLGMAALAAALWLLIEVYVRTFRGA